MRRKTHVRSYTRSRHGKSDHGGRVIDHDRGYEVGNPIKTVSKASNPPEIRGYQGWTNRETWAVKLHWDNNQGDYLFFTGQAKEFKEAGKSAWEFADFLKDQAEEIMDRVINNPKEASEEARLFASDVGSLWRVDWNEIAEAYYDEVEE